MVANAGEVNAGEFDPIDAMADLAEQHGAWLHVDGTFGLFARVSPALAPLTAGTERADSVTADGHKWLNVPFDTGFCFVRDDRLLTEVFSLEGAYLKDDPDAGGMLGLRGPEMSRRARALPVFATLAAYGRDGYRVLVEHGVALAAELARMVQQAEDFELLAVPRLCIVSFRYRPSGLDERRLDDLNTRLGEAVLRDGRIYMGTTVSRGHVAFKPAFVNWRTTSGEIALILPILQELGRQILESGPRTGLMSGPGRRFAMVDVFTSGPLTGNPLAVVFDADGLTDAQMLAVARWLNLSETAFLLPPTMAGAHYRVRIFTPDREMDFAGHPTLGSCHAWLTAQATPAAGDRFVQECGIGRVEVRRQDQGLAFAAPPLRRSGPVGAATLARIAAQLRVAPDEIQAASWVDNGAGWAGVLLKDAEAVLGLRPGAVDLDIGVVGPHRAEGPADFEVRAFFPKHGVTAEDPVTGSLNAGLAQWLIAEGRAQPPYEVRQGTVLGHEGRVRVSAADGALWIGGRATNRRQRGRHARGRAPSPRRAGLRSRAALNTQADAAGTNRYQPEKPVMAITTTADTAAAARAQPRRMRTAEQSVARYTAMKQAEVALTSTGGLISAAVMAMMSSRPAAAMISRGRRGTLRSPPT